jgi:hypothetical protein
MKPSKFLPEVSRNRLVTNWVRATHGKVAATKSRSLQSLPRVLTALPIGAALLLTFGLVFALGKPESLSIEPLPYSKVEHAVVSADSKDYVPDFPKMCSAEDLKSKLENQQLSRKRAFEPDGYALTALHDLGGLLIIEYKCSKPGTDVTFRVQWVSSGQIWRIEKISRPPSRQSGDSD